MSLEKNLSWEFLKNLADALDSYRIRVLIDAKREILEAGVYNEIQYENILYKMLDEERLKYSLFNFLKNNFEGNLETLNEFSKINSIEFKKTLSLFELLRNEKLLIVEELYDKIKGDDNNPERLVFKDFSIKAFEGDISKLKPIFPKPL
ncbi:MAG: hypothetical protein ACFFE5_04345 [Candidatus Thorarchaeota archaeon]